MKKQSTLLPFLTVLLAMYCTCCSNTDAEPEDNDNPDTVQSDPDFGSPDWLPE